MALSVTLIGCGAVAQKLYRSPLQTLQKRGILTVAALVDPWREQALRLQKSFPQARVDFDPSKSLAEIPSDLAIILTPAKSHADLAIVALEQGRHVLCEKPMAVQASACRAMIDAAARTDRVLAVGMIRRFFPALATLRRLINENQLGPLVSFSYHEGRVFDWDVATTHGFRNGQGGGGGLLYDIGPHCLDALNWIFGDLEITSYADDALAGGVEGNIDMTLRTALAPGTVRLSWDFPLRNQFRVLGRDAAAIVRLDEIDQLTLIRDGASQQVSLDSAFPVDLGTPTGKTVVPRVYAQSMLCQLVQTARAITLGEPVAASGEDGLRTTEALGSALELARPLDMPWLGGRREAAYRSLHWTSL